VKQEEEKNLRRVFIQNYGVQMEIPAYYIYDARYVPNNIEYVVTMAFHIYPRIN
jgi:hypothetical protein